MVLKLEIQFLRFTKLMTPFFVCVNCKFDLRALGEGHGDIKINNSGKNAAILWQEER